MKKIVKRVVVASLLILLASLFACAQGPVRDTRPVAAPVPEPTLIAIRDAGSPSSADKTPTPYSKSKKKSTAKKGPSAKKGKKNGAAPTGGNRPPDCPKCPDQGADAGTGAAASNPVLDALAKELSLALDANKAGDQATAPTATQTPAPTPATTPAPTAAPTATPAPTPTQAPAPK
jgi:hypothetical protein